MIFWHIVFAYHNFFQTLINNHGAAGFSNIIQPTHQDASNSTTMKLVNASTIVAGAQKKSNRVVSTNYNGLLSQNNNSAAQNASGNPNSMNSSGGVGGGVP
jgi:hypothetical protein